MNNQILHNTANELTAYLDKKNILNYSLFGGDFGGIIYLYHYSKINKEYETVADGFLDKIFSVLKYRPAIGSYCNGLAGLGIGLHYLDVNNFISGVDGALDEFDIFIEYSFDEALKTSNYDFLHGLIGIGFYYLMRYNKRPEVALPKLEKIADYLNETAVKDGNSVKWVYNPDEINKKYNISLSHGMSSMVLFLSKVLKSNVPVGLKHKAKELLIPTLNYILRQQIDGQKTGSWFPSFYFDSDTVPDRSRLAWCYGDLGVATALWQAGKVLSRADLGKLAIEILEYTAVNRRDIQTNLVFDACICHGAAGIAQIFYTMYKETGNVKLKSAYEYWRNVVLNMAAVDGIGQLTFYFYNPTEDNHRNRTSILEGVAGVGLFLLNPDSMLNELLLLR